MAIPMVSPGFPGTSPAGIKVEKNAGLIMATNNSSIVSKRSVERLYYPQPHFFQYFVRKPQRRSPTINRGYWLRMQAIDSVVKDFLHRPSKKRKAVVNLGCGYDPLPFRWLSQEPELCRDVRFVDVDYGELMDTKATIVRDSPVLEELVKPREVSRDNLVIESEHYYGVGCDLRDLRSLDMGLRPLEGLDNALVLCVAEVSVTYMEPNAADALISWAKTLSSDVTFALLEQFLPDGADHPFAKTMLRHFEKLHTPLRSIHRYRSQHSQLQRFSDAGWTSVRFSNLWELWSDPRFLTPLQRTRLDQVEPFDEWEEFALFAGHYFLLTARTQTESDGSLGPSGESATSRESTESVLDHGGAEGSFGLKYIENPKAQGLRRHGAVFRLVDEAGHAHSAVAYHGGATSEGRAWTSDIYRRSNVGADASCVPTIGIPARQCHTITRLVNGQSMLVGGRTSPAAAMKDCYIQTGPRWESIGDLPGPRFRHSAAAVVLPNAVPGLLVFGGKSASDRVQDDLVMWDGGSGWRPVPVLAGGRPEPRFGANFVALGEGFGLVCGGLRSDGVLLQDLWRWRLVFRADQSIGIAFEPITLMADSAAQPHLGRFGASHSLVNHRLLLIGGIGIAGCVLKDDEILSLDVSGLLGIGEEKDLTVQVSRMELRREADTPRPMLVGHDSLHFAQVGTLIAGGGAVCFSFGTHWNLGLYILYESGGPALLDWSLVDGRLDTVTKKGIPPSLTVVSGNAVEWKSVERVALGTRSEFLNLVKQSQPKILQEVDFGPCRALWNQDYLVRKIGADRPVVVHEAHGRSMSFQRKDFSYKTKKFGVFMNEIYNGAHQYLRSISSVDPSKRVANLDLDFPQIAGDFCHPPGLGAVTDRYHSSVLRITGNVAMWLHVDTMANVLCQIAGSKRILLFPPADMVKLDFPPGSTTSTLEIFRDGDGRDVRSVPGTDPFDTVLHAGEVLFIPPLWAHTAAPLSAVSVAVNVFFRSLSTGYAAGRDIYGNRDLEAYEHGRRDLDRIAKAFDGIPADLAHAYLLRLADELRAKADRYGTAAGL